jgi:hypothetical protein
MRKSTLGLSAVLVIALAVFPAGALGAKPIHQHVAGSTTDTDFCGTGQTVDVSWDGVENLWPGPNGTEKSTGQQKTTYTNPVNGESVVVSSSGKIAVELVDDPGGGYTYVVSYRGVQEKIKAAGGGPIMTKDAGYLTFYDHFDALDNYLGTDVVEHGQHPEADSDFALFCDVVPAALGL